LVGAAQYVERIRKVGVNNVSHPLFADRTMVLVKNGSLYARDRFGVMGVSDSILDPSTVPDTFKSRVCVEGNTPATPGHYGKFVILAQPLQSGSIGWAWASGVCVVQVDFDYEDQPYADIKDGDAGLLEAGEGGAAQVLWKVTGTGTQWAIVRLGVPYWPILRGKLDAALISGSGEASPGSSAAMSVWDGNPLADTTRNITVYDSSTLPMITADKQLASASPITAQWCGGLWYALTAKGCEVAQP
jgi:hypothetical protein